MSKYNIARLCFIPAILLAFFLGNPYIGGGLTVFLLTILGVGAFVIQWNFYFQAVNYLPKSNGLFLTFDDGPDAIHTPQVLDLLKFYNCTATFFLIGNKIKGNEDLLRRMVAEGHTLGNHTWSHSHWFDLFPTAKMKEEILATQRIIKDCTGVDTPTFRPPYGVTNPMLARAMGQTGVLSVGWSVRSLDTVMKSMPKLWHRVKGKLTPGEIVLLHDTQPNTIALLEKILVQCKENNVVIGDLGKELMSSFLFCKTQN